MLKLFSNLSQKYIYGPLKKFPGEQTFGLYRFLPFFFLFGASLEYLMCNLKAGPAQVNFCTLLLLLKIATSITII